MIDKPKTGQLIRKFHDGHTETLASDQPFPALQALKKRLIASGILSKNLIIAYYRKKQNANG